MRHFCTNKGRKTADGQAHEARSLTYGANGKRRATPNKRPGREGILLRTCQHFLPQNAPNAVRAGISDEISFYDTLAMVKLAGGMRPQASDR